jgi:hypothetical protein
MIAATIRVEAMYEDSGRPLSESNLVLRRGDPMAAVQYLNV